ncbi:MAG: TetR family transcriptional regulator [Betaproteobacteria bacterium HGW-Betaproteobacteria-14]|nr:MAG: TetR family transcriptional regulator [Betaproteobacteria bacterium HGW-Betaproteobacteria-14]
MSKPLPTAARRREVERAALRHAHDHPEWGQARVAAAMTDKGIKVSAAGVRWIWQRHHLETTAKRAAALRKPGAPRLTASQKAALARIAARRGGGPGGDAPLMAREHLLGVAVREFSRKGFARTSIRDIAQAAGIQPGSVYHHFASKEDLFIAAHSTGMREVARAVEAAVATCRDPWDRLEAAFTVHVRHLISGNDLTVWTGASLFLFNSPDMQRQLRAERNRFEAIYRRLIADLTLPHEVDRSLLRLQLLGALNWTRTWYRPGKRGAADIARHLVRVLRAPLAGK